MVTLSALHPLGALGYSDYHSLRDAEVGGRLEPLALL